MGFRFRKRIKLVPGMWVNLSKKGHSLSIGGHGATVNFSKRGVRETVSLAGCGISYRTDPIRVGRPRSSRSRVGRSQRAQARRAIPQAPRRGFWERFFFG
jgi:uncharacterized protein DUF4236